MADVLFTLYPFPLFPCHEVGPNLTTATLGAIFAAVLS